MTEHGVLTLTSVESGLRFDARFKDASMKFESCKGHTEVNPMEALLASLACCEAMDVIEILRKKRQQVTGYEIVMEGTRQEEHPRRYTAITFVHRVTGHGVDPAAVERGIELCGALQVADATHRLVGETSGERRMTDRFLFEQVVSKKSAARHEVPHWLAV